MAQRTWLDEMDAGAEEEPAPVVRVVVSLATAEAGYLCSIAESLSEIARGINELARLSGRSDLL